jgi:sulfate adenylyltransferase
LRASCSYLTADVAEKEGLKVKKLSGTKFRQMLRGGGFH